MIMHRCTTIVNFVMSPYIFCALAVLMIMNVAASSFERADSTVITSMGRALISGGCAGVADVALTQPLTYFKNMLQTGSVISCNPRDWYRGSSAQLLNMVPTTMIQVGVADVFKKLIVDDSYIGDAARAMLGGIASAPTAASTNVIVLRMQKEKRGIIDTARQLYFAAGAKGLMRGVCPTAAREAMWVLGYLSCYPRLSQNLSGVSGNLVLANLVSGVITGVGVAALTHPFDTIATCMQEDVEGRYAKSTVRTAYRITNEIGWNGLYRGLVPRASSVVAGILILGTVAEKAQEVTNRLL